ncbi:MAG: 4-hydroxythreonine-4-phosphate dehydrogenase PdxA [Deltaproteobacteria bacterium]|nr:4-hydroxythreonine-4-phosphate dehydrogenase PdxA [Deltaproteobacteria bacterium]
MGDPQGIGPEVIEKALADRSLHRLCRPIIFGDPKYSNFRSAKKLTPKECGQLSALFIQQAVHAAMNGEIDAIVTASISKERLQLAGYRFPGHTEFLAKLCRAKKVRMMMMGPRLKVVLANIHEPLKRVPELLTVSSILETIEMTDRHLKTWFRIKHPRIAVAALNPHAGEAGIFGSEEKRIIRPAVEKGCQKRINAVGPLSPDTVFYRAANGEFDAVVAMYHDQGLIPLKLLHFHEAVNITLGLPFIRTSVDHGTAFEIAGKGKANPSSMVAAIKMAVELAQHNAPSH